MAAIAAHAAPTTTATSMMKVTWNSAGNVTAAPAPAASNAAIKYWPCTPMLNRFILNPIATASADT